MGHGLPYPTIRTANVKKSVHFQNALQKRYSFLPRLLLFQTAGGGCQQLAHPAFQNGRMPYKHKALEGASTAGCLHSLQSLLTKEVLLGYQMLFHFCAKHINLLNKQGSRGRKQTIFLPNQNAACGPFWTEWNKSQMGAAANCQCAVHTECTAQSLLYQ